jgi:hypothetical protein
LNKLKEYILEQPRHYSDINKKMGIHERTLKRYLALLEELKIIENPEKGLYQAPGLTKIIYNNEKEYERALKHSRKLIFRYDCMTVEGCKHLLFQHDFGYEGDKHDRSPQFLSHLRTGYQKEIWDR